MQAHETAKVAFAPSRDLFEVPSSSIIRSSADFAGRPCKALNIVCSTLATAAVLLFPHIYEGPCPATLTPRAFR